MFRYRERGADPIQAGRELRARVVLIGRVISRGEDFIVSAELIDVCGESQLWGEKTNGSSLRSSSSIGTSSGRLARGCD